jgi:hypothetical protein
MNWYIVEFAVKGSTMVRGAMVDAINEDEAKQIIRSRHKVNFIQDVRLATRDEVDAEIGCFVDLFDQLLDVNLTWQFDQNGGRL